jgi:hypothetical protein
MKPKGGSILVWTLLVCALLPSAWLAWRFRAMPQLGAYHDDAVYLVSAKALADHSGYRIVSLPEQPFQTKYPPVFPTSSQSYGDWTRIFLKTSRR